MYSHKKAFDRIGIKELIPNSFETSEGYHGMGFTSLWVLSFYWPEYVHACSHSLQYTQYPVILHGPRSTPRLNIWSLELSLLFCKACTWCSSVGNILHQLHSTQAQWTLGSSSKIAQFSSCVFQSTSWFETWQLWQLIWRQRLLFIPSFFSRWRTTTIVSPKIPVNVW